MPFFSFRGTEYKLDAQDNDESSTTCDRVYNQVILISEHYVATV